jgi:hypothetical protein
VKKREEVREKKREEERRSVRRRRSFSYGICDLLSIRVGFSNHVALKILLL